MVSVKVRFNDSMNDPPPPFTETDTRTLLSVAIRRNDLAIWRFGDLATVREYLGYLSR